MASGSGQAYHCHFCAVPNLNSNHDVRAHGAYKHNACTGCRHRHSSWADLKSHCRQARCAMVCEGCGHRGRIFWNKKVFEQHKEIHNVCDICERHFDTSSNMMHHRLIHRAPTYECYGCTRIFTTYGGMIIHLESGICSSGVDIHEVGKSAAICYEWHRYIVDDWVRTSLLQELPMWPLIVEYGPPKKIECFQCPECDTRFTKLSGLFMHVESEACNQTLEDGEIGELRQWFSDRYS